MLESAHGRRAARAPQSFLQIWNMCFGFLGLQFGFALQNANVTRIFQTLGASLDHIPALWTAAPLTGLLVQPIIGYCSDRTWTRIGRRRPYFLIGALLATIALIAMPRAPNLTSAALLLWLLDASINVSMEPFRALVADQLAPSQRPQGYAMQSFFIGVGAIVASMLPWLFTHIGLSNEVSHTNGTTVIPAAVRWSFDVGAIVLFGAIFWTVIRTREYPAEQLLSFGDSRRVPAVATQVERTSHAGWAWTLLGVAALFAIHSANADPQLNILGGGALLWGLASVLQASGRSPRLLQTILHDMRNMPPAMRRLAPVQFFSWMALFAMWIYSTAAVSQQHFAATDPSTPAYNEAANWVGVLFAAYNGFAAIAAAVIPLMVRRLGLRASHWANLTLGGLGLVSFLFIRDPRVLLISMVGVGFAWASIVSLPYALLSDSVPAPKMGIYMGIFNLFIVIPQLLAASLLGLLIRHVFWERPIYALVVGGVSLMLAGVLALRVPESVTAH